MPTDVQGAPERGPWRVRYRLGLGVAVGLLVAVTVAAVAWATFLNTRAAIVKLTTDRVQDRRSRRPPPEPSLRASAHRDHADRSIVISRIGRS